MLPIFEELRLVEGAMTWSASPSRRKRNSTQPLGGLDSGGVHTSNFPLGHSVCLPVVEVPSDEVGRVVLRPLEGLVVVIVVVDGLPLRDLVLGVILAQLDLVFCALLGLHRI